MKEVAGVEVLPGVGKVTYRLGWRKLGGRRWRELGRALFGVAWSVAFAFLGHHWIWWLKEAGALLGVWSVLPLLLPSRGEVTVDGERVRWREAGWLKRGGSSVERAAIGRLRVDSAKHYQERRRQWGGWARMGEAHLVAELLDGREVPLVVGYPRGVVAAMAELLGRELGDAAVVDLSEVPPEAREVDIAPADCGVVMVEAGEVRTFAYARWGRWVMALRVMLVVGLVVLMGAVTTAAIVSQTWAGGWHVERAVGLGVALAVDGVWALLGWRVLKDMWRTLVLVASPEGVTVGWRGAVGSREKHWERRQITTVRVTSEETVASFRVQAKKRAVLVVTVPGRGDEAVIEGDARTWAWVATQVRRTLAAHADGTTPKDA